MFVMKKYQKQKLVRILKVFTLKSESCLISFKALLQSTDANKPKPNPLSLVKH